ncbi:MAG: 4'-phosphopantetheinyl transferase superfamily protein [Sandaracinaceae bacterium]|nr:MAG: 4'-phosphopantetheinyl transferase superfamily protein [Sandaracinaceae bacterium]
MTCSGVSFSELPDLFDDDVVVLSAPVDEVHIAELTAAERAAVARASIKRQREFATARVLARAGLARLGIEGFELLNREDRAPIWPDGIAGSISHCDTRAFVAVADRAMVGTVGVDVEHRDELARRLWRHTMLPEEIAWLDTRAEVERGRLALALFSAKEALYKAQYPWSETFMGFHALRVSLHPEDRRIDCIFQREVGPFPEGTVVHGRFTETATGELVAGVHIGSGVARPDQLSARADDP